MFGTTGAFFFFSYSGIRGRHDNHPWAGGALLWWPWHLVLSGPPPNPQPVPGHRSTPRNRHLSHCSIVLRRFFHPAIALYTHTLVFS